VSSIPDGIQPVMKPSTGPVKRITDLDLIEPCSQVHTPIWKQLQDLSAAGKANAYIQLEPLQKISASDQKDLQDIDKLWNNGGYAQAIDAISKIEEAHGITLGVGVSWIKPKELGVPDWGEDIQVESRGYSKESFVDFHIGTGNLFTVTRRENAKDNIRWTVNISTNGGGAWKETYTWSSSLGDMADVGAVVADKHLYIGYAPELSGGGSTAMRLRRCMTSNGGVDSAYHYKTVFDKGVDIVEVSLASNEDYFANRVYLLSILADNRLIYFWDDYDATSWSEGGTGITDAKFSLDTTCNEGYSDYYLLATYQSTGGRVKVAKKGSSWIVDDLDDMWVYTSISAYDDYLFIAYEYISGTNEIIKYQISYNGGGSWAYGYVSSTSGVGNYCPVVAARKGGGISVTYMQETGAQDPVWYKHRDYATVNWSPLITFNENDSVTGIQLDIEWMPDKSGDAYGVVWPSYGECAYFDRNDETLGSLTVDTVAISAANGGEVNFSLDAGASNKNRKYIILGTMSGTSPGMPLPGGVVTLPINWDGFTSGIVPFLNSPVFNGFIGTLDSSGEGKAQLNTPGPLPSGLVGVKMNFAFACNKPWNYVSNAVAIFILPI